MKHLGSKGIGGPVGKGSRVGGKDGDRQEERD